MSSQTSNDYYIMHITSGRYIMHRSGTRRAALFHNPVTKETDPTGLRLASPLAPGFPSKIRLPGNTNTFWISWAQVITGPFKVLRQCHCTASIFRCIETLVSPRAVFVCSAAGVSIVRFNSIGKGHNPNSWAEYRVEKNISLLRIEKFAGPTDRSWPRSCRS